MKIKTSDTAKIQAALDAENGKANSHTFTCSDIRKMGEQIVSHLKKNGFTLKTMKGIRGGARSGESLPSAYKQSRLINRIAFEVGSGGNVFMTYATKEPAWRDGGGTWFNFTDEQKQIVATHAVSAAGKF